MRDKKKLENVWVCLNPGEPLTVPYMKHKRKWVRKNLRRIKMGSKEYRGKSLLSSLRNGSMQKRSLGIAMVDIASVANRKPRLNLK